MSSRYLGVWVTSDRHIGHELLPTGRYSEARNGTSKAYQGTYTVTDNHIDFFDDTGFTADGEFRDDILYHVGMVLHRQTKQAPASTQIVA
jgi:Agrobacterium tumefaciens protein Atu4866